MFRFDTCKLIWRQTGYLISDSRSDTLLMLHDIVDAKSLRMNIWQAAVSRES